VAVQTDSTCAGDKPGLLKTPFIEASSSKAESKDPWMNVTSMFSEYFKTFLVQTQDQHSILEFSSLAVLACKSLFLSLKLAQELHFFEICFTKNFQT
jgi:hypothetical protein